MRRVIYASQRSPDFKISEIVQMLKDAQNYNYNNGISGLLIYGNDRFLQVIEGIKAPLSVLYSRITKDDRHHSIKTMTEEDIDMPSFNLWRMLFINLDTFGHGRGSSDVIKKFLPEEMDKTSALNFLLSIEKFLSLESENLSQEKKKVMFCDDDPNMLKLLTIFLRDQPYDLHTYSSGVELLNVYKEVKPDLIISDINMPQLDGIDLLKEIRKNDFFIPLLFSTSNQIDDRLEKALQKGADGYLLKPYFRDDLLTAIRQAILSASLIQNLHLDW